MPRRNWRPHRPRRRRRHKQEPGVIGKPFARVRLVRLQGDPLRVSGSPFNPHQNTSINGALIDQLIYTRRKYHDQSSSSGSQAPPQPQRPWWLTLIGGILAIVVGALLLWGNLVTQVKIYFLLVEVLGIWWLVDGIFDIVHMFTDHRQWG